MTGRVHTERETVRTRRVQSAGPSFWTVRVGGSILSYHKRPKDATRWLASHRPGITMRELLDVKYKIAKAYTAEARYYRKGDGQPFDPEWIIRDALDFENAMNQLRGFCHRSWEQDRSNHPSNAGRAQAWERWHDVIALIRLGELTLLKEPGFTYDFGPLSPIEGLGNRLVLSAYPTPEDELQKLVRHHV